MAHHERPHEAPPANKGLLWAAGAILAIPVIAIMWVGSYSRVEPRLGSFPFFIWYQMLWVLLTAICTSIAYRLVLKARPHRPMNRANAAADATSAGGARTDTTGTDTTSAVAATGPAVAGSKQSSARHTTTTDAGAHRASSAPDEEVQR